MNPPAATVRGQQVVSGVTRPQFPRLLCHGARRRRNRRHPPIRRHRHGM